MMHTTASKLKKSYAVVCASKNLPGTELPSFDRGNIGAYNSGITFIRYCMHATIDTPPERRTEVACQDARTKQFETHLGWYVGLPPLEGILRRHKPGQAHLQKLHRLLDVALYHRVLQEKKSQTKHKKTKRHRDIKQGAWEAGMHV